MTRILIPFLSLLLLVSCSDKKETGNLHITGNIEGLQDGTLYIQRVEDTALVVIDSIRIQMDSHFESHLTIDSPEMLYLYLDRGTSNSMDTNLPFFAEPGNMTINTDLKQFFAKAKITGSKNHDLFEEYKKTNSRFTNQRLELTEKKLRAIKKKDLVRLDSIQKAEDLLMKRKYLFATNFALNNRNMEIAPYIALAEISDINLKYLDTIRRAMSPAVAKSLYGKKLISYYDERAKESGQ